MVSECRCFSDPLWGLWFKEGNWLWVEGWGNCEEHWRGQSRADTKGGSSGSTYQPSLLGRGQWGHREPEPAMFCGLRRKSVTLRREGTHFPISTWHESKRGISQEVFWHQRAESGTDETFQRESGDHTDSTGRDVRRRGGTTSLAGEGLGGPWEDFGDIPEIGRRTNRLGVDGEGSITLQGLTHTPPMHPWEGAASGNLS